MKLLKTIYEVEEPEEIEYALTQNKEVYLKDNKNEFWVELVMGNICLCTQDYPPKVLWRFGSKDYEDFFKSYRLCDFVIEVEVFEV